MNGSFSGGGNEGIVELDMEEQGAERAGVERSCWRSVGQG